MLALKLAYKNLVGAGLRTWLNVFVLSLAYVLIIWHRGFLDGWNVQARFDTINWEIGGGVYWQEVYDPYDPFTLQDSHGTIPKDLAVAAEKGEAAPILVTQGTLYPQGRIQSCMLRGIDPGQQVLEIPTEALNDEGSEIPAVIGTKMAKNTHLAQGDRVTLRWRDANGSFDAAEVKIVSIFKTNVPSVDGGILWIPLTRMQEMMSLPGEATMIVTGKETGFSGDYAGWTFKDHKFLLKEIEDIIRMKSVGGSIFHLILLMLAWLAIFDTQVLSVFRRQKEIGTDIALGMTRGQVVRLFTIEGAMHGILAIGMAAVYGIPLLWLQATKGFAMPGGTEDYGMAIADVIYPYYSLGLVVGTVVIVMVSVVIVSFLPARKITQMNPTDAIRGKIQ